MLPKFAWTLDDYNLGLYYPEDNLITASPYQSQASFFWSMLHELGHWLLFRLGQSDAVHTLNCAWDMVDYVVTNKRPP